MPLGAAPLSLEQPVMPTPEEKWGHQHTQTECRMLLGTAPLKLEQPVMPAPGFFTAKNNPSCLQSYDAPAKEKCVPQQPQTECYMPLGASPLSLQQPVMPAPGFHCAQTSIPPLPPYHVQAEEMFSPQQCQTGHYMPLGAAPFSLQPPVMPAPGPAYPRYQRPNALQPNYMYCQAAPFSHSQVNNGPVVSHPQGLTPNLVPVGFINGEIVYGVSAYSDPPVASNVPVVNTFVSRKKRCFTKPHNESSPYVKKPPNAFMIFRMEQRPNVVVELQNSDCAAVNRLIGHKWKSLSKEEQEKYYELAEREKRLHSQAFPDWSARDNYATKRKRIRRRGPAMT